MAGGSAREQTGCAGIFFFFQAEDGIRDDLVTGVQTCALPISYGMAAMCYAQRKWMGWAADRQHEIAETTRLAHLAAQLGRDDAVALSSAGYAQIGRASCRERV